MWEIYSLISWQWWVSLVWFGIAISISWFVPGLLFLSYTKLSKQLQFFIAPVLGICFWALQGYMLGWLQLRWLTYPVLLGLLGWAWLRRNAIVPLVWRLKLPATVWLVLVIGVLLQMVSIWGSGWRTEIGPTYYFVNIYDGLFHLSLSRSLADAVPPYQPGAAGMLVTNYHYLSNLVIAELSRVWFLPLNHLYFHYVPVFLSSWMGILVALLLRTWGRNTRTVVIGLLLFYAAGELTWLIDLFLGRNSPEPFEVFIDHGVLQFLNPPQAFAKAVFFSVLLLWHEFWKKRDAVSALILGVLTACLLGFKVYFGLAAGLGMAAALGMLLLQGLFGAYRRRQRLNWVAIRHEAMPFVLLLAVVVLLGAAIYVPTNAAAGGLFFDFLTWPKLLLGVQKLNWNEWWLRLQVYEAAENTRALVVWYSLAAGIFALAIYHLRMIGVLVVAPWFRQKLTTPEVWFLLVPAVVFTIIGTNFLQTSGGSNSFNFLVVAIAILNLLTAVVLGALPSNRLVQLGIAVVLAITMVQTGFMQYFYFKNYTNRTNGFAITADHEVALEHVSQQLAADAVVQTHPNHVLDKVTPYVYFFTGHQTYLGGVGILESHNQNIVERKSDIDRLFLMDPSQSAELAQDLKITHLLLRKGELLEDAFMNSATASATLSAIPRWLRVVDTEEVVLLERVVPEGWLPQK